jgi:tRNA splicing ligase
MQGHEDLAALREIISLLIKHILEIIKNDPSKLHRTTMLSLDRSVRLYSILRKLYGADTKEIKIQIEEV